MARIVIDDGISTARETTVNIRASHAEKQLWKAHAPDGKLSAWIRLLIAKEIAK